MVRIYPRLGRELQGKDGARRTLADWLIDQGRVLMVLDGLDEVSRENQRAAFRKLSEAASKNQAMVVTCRTKEYAQIVYDAKRQPLPKTPVVRLHPLPPAQVRTYLTKADDRQPASPRFGQLLERIESDPGGPLAAALSSPFALWLVYTVYRDPDMDPAELLGTAVGLAAAIRFSPHAGVLLGILFAIVTGVLAGVTSVRPQEHPRTVDLRFTWDYWRFVGCLTAGIAVGLCSGFADARQRDSMQRRRMRYQVRLPAGGNPPLPQRERTVVAAGSRRAHRGARRKPVHVGRSCTDRGRPTAPQLHQSTPDSRYVQRVRASYSVRTQLATQSSSIPQTASSGLKPPVTNPVVVTMSTCPTVQTIITQVVPATRPDRGIPSESAPAGGGRRPSRAAPFRAVVCPELRITHADHYRLQGAG